MFHNDEEAITCVPRVQMEYARELLDEIHPIEDTPLCVVFPWLKCLSCCCGQFPKYRSQIRAEEEE